MYVENEVLVGSGCMWMQQGMAVGFMTTRLRVVFWLTRRVQKAFSAMLVALASIVVVAESVWHFCCVLHVWSGVDRCALTSPAAFIAREAKIRRC